MKTLKLFPYLFLFSALLFMSSCGDEDPVEETCDAVSTIDGSVKINGENHGLTVAQLLVSAGGATFGDTYQFLISAVNGDCTEVRSVNFSLSLDSGTDLNGSYDIKDFFSAGDEDAYGSFSVQILDPISQSAEDLVSGSVSFVKNGNKAYEIDLEATTVTGEDVSLEMNHEF